MSEELETTSELKAAPDVATEPSEKSVKQTISELEENKNQYYKGICYPKFTPMGKS